MPYTSAYVEPEVAINHRGVTVWKMYRDDDMAQGEPTFYFTLDPEQGPESRSIVVFDVRDLPSAKPHAWSADYHAWSADYHDIVDVLRQSIEAGELPDEEQRAAMEEAGIVIPTVFETLDCGCYHAECPCESATCATGGVTCHLCPLHENAELLAETLKRLVDGLDVGGEQSRSFADEIAEGRAALAKANRP